MNHPNQFTHVDKHCDDNISSSSSRYSEMLRYTITFYVTGKYHKSAYRKKGSNNIQQSEKMVIQ